MAVTLQALYDGVRKQEEITLVAGAYGMNQEVHWIHMVEGKLISDFLEGGEIAFTTGVALNSPQELYELVEFNYQKKVAGMVINVGPYIQEIPAEVITFGDAHDFPIFEVPWRVHMANIMRYFSMQINLDEQKSMECSSALKNAVYFPENEELYLPTFLKYGYKREWSYCIAVMELCDQTYHVVKSAERDRLRHLIQRNIPKQSSPVMVQEIDQELVFLFTNSKDEKVSELLETVWKEITMYLPKGVRSYVGIGRSTKSIHCIGKCFHQAVRVKKLQKKQHHKNSFLTYNELGVYKLLLSIENQDIVQEYYQETLGKLEKYDRMNETDYLYFLKQYFSLNCSVQAVAASLHLHRNSVAYKLHKCEEIIGMSIGEQEVRMGLMIAFKIREIQ